MTTQLDAFVGLKKETTYGTYAAPSSFLTFTDESLEQKVMLAKAAGMRPGRRTTAASQDVVVGYDASGDITVEMASGEGGILWEALLGQATHTVLPSATATYQHLYTPAADYLPSYTIQKAIPPLGGGPLMPWTFGGMQLDQLDVDFKAGAIPTLKSTWKGQNLIAAQSVAYNAATGVTTNPGAASPVYPAINELLSYVGGQILVAPTATAPVVPPTATALATGGTVVGQIVDGSLSFKNALDAGGITLGGGGTNTRALASMLGDHSGSLTAEFRDASFWGYYTGQVPLSLVLNFVGSPTGESTYSNCVQICIPSIRLTGETPKIKSGSIVTQSTPFDILQDLVAGYAPFTVATRNKIATL